MRARLPILLALAAASCRPDLGDRDSLVTSERILAVRGEPPEAKPGEPVSYTILVASPTGAIAVPPVNWAFCASPKLLSENNVVSPVAYGRNLKLNPVAVLISVMFWWFLWGVPGAFLAVPMVATAKVIADHSDGLKAVGEFLGA